MRITAAIILLTLAFGWSSATAQEPDYLSAGEAAVIGGGSVGVWVLGLHVKRFDQDRSSRWTNPPAFDRSISRWLGGDPKPGKRNFLDDSFGSSISGIVAGAAIFGTDMAYPIHRRGRDAAQNQLLFVSGLVATKGVTDIFKGLFARPRPLAYFAPNLADSDTLHNWRYHRQSFCSGHASSAFFAMTFLNLHTRAVLRRELSPDDYRTWRWVSPVVTYGWATFVALSRIQAYRHYFTDVAAGALVGYLLGELYYSWSDDLSSDSDNQSASTPLQLRVAFRF